MKPRGTIFCQVNSSTPRNFFSGAGEESPAAAWGTVLSSGLGATGLGARGLGREMRPPWGCCGGAARGVRPGVRDAADQRSAIPRGRTCGPRRAGAGAARTSGLSLGIVLAADLMGRPQPARGRCSIEEAIGAVHWRGAGVGGRGGGGCGERRLLQPSAAVAAHPVRAGGSYGAGFTTPLEAGLGVQCISPLCHFFSSAVTSTQHHHQQATLFCNSSSGRGACATKQRPLEQRDSKPMASSSALLQAQPRIFPATH
jgi:hypothetical protein